MDKTIYHKKRDFKLFGKIIFQIEDRHEEVFLEDVEPINPIVMLNLELNDRNKRN